MVIYISSTLVALFALIQIIVISKVTYCFSAKRTQNYEEKLIGKKIKSRAKQMKKFEEKILNEYE